MNREQYFNYTFVEIHDFISGRFLVTVKYRGFLYSGYSDNKEWYERYKLNKLTLSDMKFMSLYIRSNCLQRLRY